MIVLGIDYIQCLWLPIKECIENVPLSCIQSTHFCDAFSVWYIYIVIYTLKELGRSTSATLSRLGGLDLEGIQLGHFC
jgi:hypothetical protein